MKSIITIKKPEVVQELPKCDGDMKWANAVVKMVPLHSTWNKVATGLQFVKKQKQNQNTQPHTVHCTFLQWGETCKILSVKPWSDTSTHSSPKKGKEELKEYLSRKLH